MESGPVACSLAAARGDVVVVVDVLSFSTTVTMAVEMGATVLPLAPAEIEAAGGPEAVQRTLRGERISATRQVGPRGMFSLSPASLAALRDPLGREPGKRLIFTSLNGARCVHAARDAPLVLVGCLRNATAVADRIVGTLGAAGPRVTIVACAESWTSTAGVEGQRPALEDWAGAGAIAAACADRGLALSVEARAAAHTHGALGDPGEWLPHTVSGRELVDRGFAEDVELAARVDVNGTVPEWNPRTDLERSFRTP